MGREEQGHWITCDGQQLEIQRNLHEALPYLRLTDRERILWIDAICIDQTNNDEKSKQTRLMKDIYKNASQVIIWLGLLTENARGGCAMLDMFKRSIDMNNGYYQYDFNRNAESGIMPPVSSHAWTGLVKLFQREWFLRVWVIQEAVMASKVWVQYGSHYVNWNVIVQVSKACQNTGYLGAYTIQSSAAGTHSAVVVDLLKNSKEEATLINLLALTRFYGATDHRDRVFALLNIAVDGKDFENPDYGPTNTAQKVYRSVAKISLEQHRSLECLSSAGLSSGDRLPDLPTWVPNWMDQNDHRFIMNSTRFSAAGNTTPDLKICDNDTTLKIRGWVIETIKDVNPLTRKVEQEKVNPGIPSIEMRILAQEKRAIEDCDKLLAAHFKPPISAKPMVSSAFHHLTRGLVPNLGYKPPPELEEPLWRTLCCDLTPKGDRAPNAYAGGWKYWREMFRITNKNGFIFLNFGERKYWDLYRFDAREVEHAVRRWTFGRNFCVTREGALVHAPHGTKAGDKVVVFKGGRVPFLVRDVAGGHCQLVGECYIHGMMDGEVLKREDIMKEEKYFLIQ